MLVLRECRLRAVDGVRGEFDVDARVVWQLEADPVERHDPTELGQERRQAAVLALRPQRLDEIVACQRPVAIGGEERKEDPSLPSWEPAFDSLAAELDHELAAELNLRGCQPDANIATSNGS